MAEVRVLKCGKCGALDAGPRLVCSRCYAQAFEPQFVSGAGTLLSWTIIRRPPTKHKALGQYAVCVVDLDAGVRVTGRLDDIAHAWKPSMKVKCVLEDGGVAIFTEAQ